MKPENNLAILIFNQYLDPVHSTVLNVLYIKQWGYKLNKIRVPELTAFRVQQRRQTI